MIGEVKDTNITGKLLYNINNLVYIVKLKRRDLMSICA